MLIDDLAKELNRSCFGAAEGEKVVTIHLFGIKFADAIAGIPCKEIAIKAGIDESYGTEIRKDVNLAKYVNVK